MADDEKVRADDKIKPVGQSPTTSNPQRTTEVDSAYSRFSTGEKWFIVCFTAFVGLFSPLTANIYFPAIPTISQAFNKSTELINLTVTMYMVLQGVAPMLWGPVSDHVGRRPISAACLLILSLSCVGLALVPTKDYWLLMVLRCLQATGSASTIAIERGGFFGVFTIGPMIGPAIGPVIGGVLSQHLGWRSIFWFLCIAASICFTLHSIVDSSRSGLLLIYKPVIPIIGRNNSSNKTVSPPRPKVPKNPFRIFLNPDIDVLLLVTALICAVFYGVLATISTLFVTTYPFLNETTIGLCFLGLGGGMAIGSSVNGHLLDAEYQRFKRLAEALQSDTTSPIDLNREESFPLEKARLRLVPYFVVLMSAVCAGYGWCIEKTVNIAGPLILQFVGKHCGICQHLDHDTCSTLMIDLLPGQSSSVTACNNLIRCTLIGWTYVLLCGMGLLSVPLIYLAIHIGPRYRIKRQRQRELEIALVNKGPE
ncbi:major facilitator superfamily domain-containing protein [Gymnopilus junonius]|uniref:Major facilitator superfamily domain-containing protein n=1 Tax=Gymnopilus junonius TaxID=109634 RepID=A0A9P5P373_GYMJU|nr:major facilitator superfamily domain-containing protein [Gymnopilus junonius]